MVGSARMSRAFGNERANRSSLVTTRVSPDHLQAAGASWSPGLSRAGQAVVDLDAVITDVESTQGISLGGAILLVQ